MNISMPSVIRATTLFVFVFLSFGLFYAQKPQTQVNGFGHVEFTYLQDKKQSTYFSIGEHDLFVSSKIKNKISFLGEYVLQSDGRWLEII
jgi:hypothetical protein